MLLKGLYRLGLTNVSENEVNKAEYKIKQIELEKELKEKITEYYPVIKVVGVGGGGCNAIDSMIKRRLFGVKFVAINTDAQVLKSSSADFKIQVGLEITRGLGAGADPKIGRKAVEEERERIADVLAGSDMVFVIAGMGGGTGTGGVPIVASVAQSIGALVVGIVTKPFKWEGKLRLTNAEEGINNLRKYVDSFLVISNERLLHILDGNLNAFAAFDKPNEILYEAIRGITDMITTEGLINVDFADIRTVMNQSGEALLGFGIASGENRAIEAAMKAISSPLLEGANIRGAKSVIFNVSGSSNLTLYEINEGNNVIFEASGGDANVIFGCVRKEEMNDYVSYTVIATGFDNSREVFIGNESNDKHYFWGGSSFVRKTVLDEKDLDVPTILKVKSSLDESETPGTDDQENSSKKNISSPELSKEKINQKKSPKKTDDEKD